MQGKITVYWFQINPLKCGKVQIFRNNVANKNWIHKETESRLNPGNACYDFVAFQYLHKKKKKNLKIKAYKTILLPAVLYGCEIWSLTLRKWFPNCGERDFLVVLYILKLNLLVLRISDTDYLTAYTAFTNTNTQLQHRSIQLKDFSGHCISWTQGRIQQLFVLEIWQHCHRHFELLCLPTASQQLTFLATVHT